MINVRILWLPACLALVSTNAANTGTNGVRERQVRFVLTPEIQLSDVNVESNSRDKRSTNDLEDEMHEFEFAVKPLVVESPVNFELSNREKRSPTLIEEYEGGDELHRIEIDVVPEIVESEVNVETRPKRSPTLLTNNQMKLKSIGGEEKPEACCSE